MGIMGAEQTMYHFELLPGLVNRMFEAQTPSEQMPRKEEGEQWNPATGRCSEGLQRLLALILLGFQMQRLKAEPHETSKYQDFEKDRCLNPRAEVGSRWRMIQNCSIKQEEEKRNSQGMDPSTPERNSQRTRVLSEETARRRTREPQMAEATE